MAESCAPLPVGGYENEFVDSIPDTLSCPICLLPFRDPHLVSCCGAKFCEPCIGRVKAAGQPCPLCKQEFNTMLDRSYRRKVLELKVRCSMKNDGCQWMGELRHMVHHEREECGWTAVECSYQCGAHLPRRLMDEHEHDMCLQRPMDIKLESFMKRIEERHEREMKKMEAAMETKLVTERERHERGIRDIEKKHRHEIAAMKSELSQQHELELAKQRKEMEIKLAELKNEYTSKLAETLKRVMKIEEETIPQLRVISSHPVPAAIEFIMTQYTAHKKNKDEWYSPPFYTGPGGYKMCVKAGFAAMLGTIDLVCSVHLMRGEYDGKLVWPFKGDITIQLVNHNDEQDHHEETMRFHDVSNATKRVTFGEMATTGMCMVIPHTDVESSRYLINDCLTFRVTKVVLYS